MISRLYFQSGFPRISRPTQKNCQSRRDSVTIIGMDTITDNSDSKDTENPTLSGTGIYADIQNLQEISRDVLLVLARRWPRRIPKPTRLNLYVRADHLHLWSVWAKDAFPNVEVTVKGVQHYSLAATKNAADMAIAVDAISDFNHKRVSHVAVVSDDSDFISLFAKLAEEVGENAQYEGEYDDGVVPFLWVFTDRRDTKSTLLQDFFPERYVYMVDRYAMWDDDYDDEYEDAINGSPSSANDQDANGGEGESGNGDDESASSKEERPPAPAPSIVSAPSPPPQPRSAAQSEMSEDERIAIQIIRDMPVGKFKSTDCQSVIKGGFPNSPLAEHDGPAFGIAFRRDLFPILEKRGVREIGNQKPRQYEMTHEAKRSLLRF